MTTTTQPTQNDQTKLRNEQTAARTEARGWTRKIGISAVAAAVRYQGALRNTGYGSSSAAPDRSTARGWSSAHA